MFAAQRNPDLFHGWGKRRDFFEGWYFKLVEPRQEQVFAFIPGLSLARQVEDSHSFIQVVDGRRARLQYLRYPVDSFHSQRRIFAIEVGASSFSLDRLSLQIDGPQMDARGVVEFSNIKRWPDSLLNPGSMGFYNYLPRMQCYSQVCAMDMDLVGELEIDGQRIDFTGGRGYVEKNWGRAFPISWIWLQSNNFAERRASLSCSLGHIPFLAGSFRGFLVGLLVEDQFYEFTSINRTKARVERRGNDISIDLRNARHRLTIDAVTNPEQFVLLKGPRDGRMEPLVQENLLGQVRVRLTATDSGRLRFAGEGLCAGVEYGGEQMHVLDPGD